MSTDRKSLPLQTFPPALVRAGTALAIDPSITGGKQLVVMIIEPEDIGAVASLISARDGAVDQPGLGLVFSSTSPDQKAISF